MAGTKASPRGQHNPDIEETLQAVADDPVDGAHRWANFVLPRLQHLRSS